jgi:hypothetical protein
MKDHISSLGAELRELGTLRWQLARIEVQSAIRQAKRLAIALCIAAVMALAALPLLAVALAELLRGALRIPYWGWLVIFGTFLLAASGIAACLAWRGFRRRFVGMEQTIEELREDAVWLREHLRAGREARREKDDPCPLP